MPARLARNWWVLALRGAVSILFGIACLIYPISAIEVLVIFYGAYAFVDGVMALVLLVAGRDVGHRWGSLLIEGIFGIAVGVITFFMPQVTILALLYVVAFWALVTGIFEIGAAMHLRAHVPGEWSLLLAGILSILFALVLIFWPGASVVALVWLIGVYAIIFGVVFLVLAFRLRRWGQLASPGGWPGVGGPAATPQ